MRLLLVDDHADSIRGLKRLLEMEGHEIHAATDCFTALATAAKGSFDLVISDIGLPDGSGAELLREMKLKFGLSGIALTGSDDPDTTALVKAAGISQHLVKPVDPTRLRVAIAKTARVRSKSPA